MCKQNTFKNKLLFFEYPQGNTNHANIVHIQNKDQNGWLWSMFHLYQ